MTVWFLAALIAVISVNFGYINLVVQHTSLTRLLVELILSLRSRPMDPSLSGGLDCVADSGCFIAPSTARLDPLVGEFETPDLGVDTGLCDFCATVVSSFGVYGRLED